jgi:hypothetical protein
VLPQVGVTGADRPTFSLTPLDASEYARRARSRCSPFPSGAEGAFRASPGPRAAGPGRPG